MSNHTSTPFGYFGYAQYKSAQGESLSNHEKRLEAAQNHDKQAKEINEQYQPLIKEAVSKSDYARAEYLEEEREAKLTKNTQDWAQIDEQLSE